MIYEIIKPKLNYLKELQSKELSNIITSNFENSYSKRNLRNQISKMSSLRESQIPLTILSPSPPCSPKSKDKNISKFSKNLFNNYQKFSITNNNILLKLDEKLLKKNKVFSNEILDITSSDSFSINRSYININEITDGAFLNKKNVQKDIIKFIIDYKNHKIKNNKKENYSLILKPIKKESKFSVLDDSIRKATKKMSIYLNNKIKIMAKKSFNLRKKTKNEIFNMSNNSSGLKINNIKNISFNENSIENLNFHKNKITKYDDS